MTRAKSRPLSVDALSVLGYAAAVIFLVPAALLVVLLLLFRFFRRIWYGVLVSLLWKPRGKKALLAYSYSVKWQSYFEENVLPRVGSQTMILNWSERHKQGWDQRLEYKIWAHWLGVERSIVDGKKYWSGREFCPAVIIFSPWYRPKVIRFWDAFKDFKHGKEAKLKAREEELFSAL